MSSSSEGLRSHEKAMEYFMETLPQLASITLKKMRGKNHTFSRELLISLLRPSVVLYTPHVYPPILLSYRKMQSIWIIRGASDDRTLPARMAQIIKSRESIECHLCSVARVSVYYHMIHIHNSQKGSPDLVLIRCIQCHRVDKTLDATSGSPICGHI